jgi:O-acetyl-ADP-ribose deacetylase (regulator of RNase III)
MPIIFISLNKKFIEKIKLYNFESYLMNIQDYVPKRKTYYVSPANSLCFMDGGIDLVLSRTIFPNIEKEVKKIVKELNITTKLGRPYLPIGSSIIIDSISNKYISNKSLIVAPTMLLPQDVSKTNNAYIATISILYNILINKQENLNDIDIIFTSLCCGYGKMDEDDSIKQILKGIQDYKSIQNYKIMPNIIINEPNLLEQPKYYQNMEFFDISVNDIITIK